jgi:hypothetical protein
MFAFMVAFWLGYCVSIAREVPEGVAFKSSAMQFLTSLAGWALVFMLGFFTPLIASEEYEVQPLEWICREVEEITKSQRPELEQARQEISRLRARCRPANCSEPSFSRLSARSTR